jgi:DNA/RNA-binding domain of Phe-tRNA-synthetase-like protein
MNGSGAAEPRVDGDPVPRQGWVAPHIAAEFPGLGIAWVELDSRPAKSPEPVRRRLRDLSDRFFGAQAIHMRERPIPWAYRVFFRHIGLDPDTTRTPVEQLIFERIHDGRFKSRNRIDDALTIAMVEVGVALRAFDADRVDGRVGLRLSEEREAFEGRTSPLPDGTIVVADEKRALGILFDRTAEGRGVRKGTSRVLLVAIGVRGVPDIALEEGLWVAGSALRA